MIRIKCTKCLEILELTDEFQTCSCHLVCIRAKIGDEDWKSRIGGKQNAIILNDDSTK